MEHWDQLHQYDQAEYQQYLQNNRTNIKQVYQQHINLLKHALVGPFDFAVPRHYQQESNRIAFEEWEELKSAAAEHNVDTSNIEDIIPLY